MHRPRDELCGTTPDRLLARGEDAGRQWILALQPLEEAFLLQPVENARERRSLMREAAVQLRDAGRARRRQVRENVGLALREAVLTQVGQVEADPMRRSMDGRDKTKRHQQ